VVADYQQAEAMTLGEAGGLMGSGLGAMACAAAAPCLMQNDAAGS